MIILSYWPVQVDRDALQYVYANWLDLFTHLNFVYWAPFEISQ